MRNAKLIFTLLVAVGILIVLHTALEKEPAQAKPIETVPTLEAIAPQVESAPLVQLAIVRPEVVIPERQNDFINSENIWILVNEMRAQYGGGVIAQNSRLDEVAQLKANDMAARGYFSHVDPDGNKIFPEIKDHGYYYQRAGENLGLSFTSAQALMDAWMLSETHRANILDPRFDDIGFGIAYGEYQGYENVPYIVTIYGSKD